MPKPTAIKLSEKTAQLISEELNIPEGSVRDELYEPFNKTTFYYVKDPILTVSSMDYLIYSEAVFLEEFASVPPGIEERFVPVTQVSSKP